MKLLKRNRLKIESVDRIGGLIPRNKLTLFTGLAGSGKSYSVIKFLNQEDITPIYFNLDETEIGDHDADIFGGSELDDLFSLKYTDIENRVIVLDTYTRLESHFNIFTNLSKKEIVDKLEAIVSYYKCTLIVIAHPEEYVGKDGVFKDNIYLARNSYEFLHLEKDINSSTIKKVTTKTTNYFLYVNKGRGYKGARIINSWMRD